MKRHILNMLQFLLLIFLLLTLISFSFKKQSFKYCSINKINISQQQNKFLSPDIIINYLDSLSIYPSLTRLDSISLYYIESSLLSHPLVKEANVFSDINGLIDIDLTARNPIARIRSDQEYYIDDEGKEMPLSSEYTSRVLVVIGDLTYIDTSFLLETLQLIYFDEFLRDQIVQMEIKHKEILMLTKSGVILDIGTLDNFSDKCYNFKLYYNKGYVNIEEYRSINLKYNQQIICSKK